MVKFLRKLWPFVRPYRSRLLLGLVCGILFALLNGLMIVTIKKVVDLVFPGEGHTTFSEQLAKVRPEFLQHFVENILSHFQAPTSKSGKIFMITLIPVIMLVRALVGYFNVYLTNWSAVRAIADIRTTLFDHLQNLSLSFFNEAKTGDLISRITNDTQILYGIIGNSLASMIKDPITLVTTFVFLFMQQPELTTVSLIVLPACLVPIMVYGRKVRKSSKAMQGHNSELTSLMHESFTSNRIIKAYNLEQTMVGQFRETTKKYISHMMRVVKSNELPSQLTEFLAGVGIALVLIYVVMRLGEPKTGDFVAFIVGIVVMYQPIKSLSKLYNQMRQAEAASHRVFELLDTINTIAEPASPQPLKAAHADIAFEHIEFNYGEKPVLRGIDLTVKAGQLVALVGSSGSGKTTLVNLLPRFYDPQGGVVRIGSADIRQVSVKELRRQIAVVTQETILFHDTIRRNIAVGRPEATAAEIEAAARAANAHEFIMQKPDGYDSVVGEKGVALSGGQRQRISIARAILKDAPILILDEAANALDAESERIVQTELEKLMEHRTTICIAHRLSTVQKADRIVVMSEGKIVETGTHAELLQRGGVYQRLYELQFQGH